MTDEYGPVIVPPRPRLPPLSGLYAHLAAMARSERDAAEQAASCALDGEHRDGAAE
jgi:hypothetical protein